MFGRFGIRIRIKFYVFRKRLLLLRPATVAPLPPPRIIIFLPFAEVFLVHRGQSRLFA